MSMVWFGASFQVVMARFRCDRVSLKACWAGLLSSWGSGSCVEFGQCGEGSLVAGQTWIQCGGDESPQRRDGSTWPAPIPPVPQQGPGQGCLHQPVGST